MNGAFNPAIIRDPSVYDYAWNWNSVTLANVYANPLLYSYIVRLSEMVVDVETPSRYIYVDALVKLRTHGYVFIVPIDSEIFPYYAVSNDEYLGEGKAVINLKYNRVDFNVLNVSFDPTEVISFRWNNNGGRIVGDLTEAVYYTALKANQLLNQIYIGGVKSQFFIFSLPNGLASNTAIEELEKGLSNVDFVNGLIVQGDVGVNAVKNETLHLVTEAYEQYLRAFAGLTGLPVSFYRGERSGGGLSDAGEQVDYQRVIDRVELIRTKVAPLFNMIGGLVNE